MLSDFNLSLSVSIVVFKCNKVANLLINFLMQQRCIKTEGNNKSKKSKIKEGRSNHSRKSDRGAPSRPQRACDLPGRAAWRRLPIAPRLPHVGGSPGKQRVAFPTSIPQRRGNEDLLRCRHRMAAIKPDLHASESPERQSLRMQGFGEKWQLCNNRRRD